MAMLCRQFRFALLLLGLGAFPLKVRAQDSDTLREAAPPLEAQQSILAAMRQYSERYVTNLPNFTCDQVTRQFQAGKKPTHWRKGDTLTSKLVFSNGHEDRSLKFVNNKPVASGVRYWRAPLTTEGEFGILLGNVLGSASEATYKWNRWEVVSGKRLAVFDYSIDKYHSTLRLTWSDLAHATVAYHGALYADPITGVIWRITNAADDIPVELRTKSISTVIEYDQVSIAGRPHILPVRATVLMDTGSSNVRNELEFENYQKFETNSTITFSSDAKGSGPPPQP